MARNAAEIEQMIRDAYQSCAVNPGAWVSLTRLREAIGDVSRHDIDAALIQMNRQQGVNLIPESNQKTLNEIDWDCAVWTGNQWKHLISIC